MDWLIRLIEGLIQGIMGAVQPLIDNGNLGYFVPLVLLLVMTWVMLTSKNRLCLTAYILGWGLSIAVMALYQEARGDTLLVDVTGVIPRSDMLAPGFWGLVVGFLLLLPFIRLKLSDALPIIVALVTASALIMIYLAYRASASVGTVQTSGLADLIVYRKRYVGIFALTFSVGVLAHILMSAANPRRPPPSMLPPQFPPQH
ncbi:MAG: hypothetical protein R3E39_15660 [Anaerolineae bacterium]